MDFLFFVLCTAVLLILTFLGGSTARVVAGVGFIVLGVIAMGEGLQLTYVLAWNNSTIVATHDVLSSNVVENNTTLIAKDRYLILPLVYVFGGIAVLVSSFDIGGGGRSGGFNYAD